MRRVVITGVGLNSPLGNSYDELYESLKNEKCGIEYIPEWENIHSLGTKVAGLVKNIDLQAIPRKFRRSMGRVAQLSAVSTGEAIKDAELSKKLLVQSAAVWHLAPPWVEMKLCLNMFLR